MQDHKDMAGAFTARNNSKIVQSKVPGKNDDSILGQARQQLLGRLGQLGGVGVFIATISGDDFIMGLQIVELRQRLVTLDEILLGLRPGLH
ncbi:hypothetical protein GCM10023156_50380 [Novipirellula rosea]|uniref:Uncharacterized protein n=1 Tax=Novipirellula rosea TaxID=1031540 RepID=A0ABP8NAQ5_9BACT